MRQTNKKMYSVPAIERMVKILDLLCEEEVVYLNEVYTKLRLPKTTVYVLVETLQQQGLLQRTADGRLLLGLKSFYWGMNYYKKQDLKIIAQPHLRRLVDKTPYSAHLAILSGFNSVYIDKVEGGSFVRFATYIGQATPFHLSAIGKALVLEHTDEQIVAMLAMNFDKPTEKSLQTEQHVLDDIIAARQRGYTVESEEFERGIRCIGAPIYGLNHKIVGAISLISQLEDLPTDTFGTIGLQVKETADRISLDLGN